MAKIRDLGDFWQNLVDLGGDNRVDQDQIQVEAGMGGVGNDVETNGPLLVKEEALKCTRWL